MFLLFAVKSPKFSLFWKFGDSKSCGKGVDVLRSRRLLCHLLPWKRATYWRFVWQKTYAISIEFDVNIFACWCNGLTEIIWEYF